ncbi:MAG: terpene cyclase/mutase family protein [Planctomycetaceae bacterium]|nr:terpene cyclase/mutase family protein [Planctomycetaceae bacterium]
MIRPDLVVGDELEGRVDSGVSRAVRWLADRQQPSGAWLTEQYGESSAATSLAVMAMMAAGHVPEEGPYGRHLTRGVAWVLSEQQPDGLLVGERRSHGPMYSHGIATLMLAEVSGMVSADQAPRCKTALEKAVRLIVDAQNHPKSGQHDGGWRYQPTSGDADLSVTAWQLLALRAAKDIGCDIPSQNIDRAVAYIKRLRVERGGGFGYMAGHGATVTRSGTGIVALEVCGEHRTPETMAAARYILNQPLRIQEHYFYYGAYYCTVGMFKIGGEEWLTARPVLYETILEAQDASGGWTPQQGSERGAGEIYATSLALLALCIEYGYLPIYQR